jgi:hypothetical protein
MPAVATEAAARRPHAIAAAPAAIIVSPGLVIAAHVPHPVVAVISGAAHADRAPGGHERNRSGGDERSLARRKEDSHFSSASS